MGAGKLNVTYENVEGLTDYFYLPFERTLHLNCSQQELIFVHYNKYGDDSFLDLLLYDLLQRDMCCVVHDAEE